MSTFSRRWFRGARHASSIQLFRQPSGCAWHWHGHEGATNPKLDWQSAPRRHVTLMCVSAAGRGVASFSRHWGRTRIRPCRPRSGNRAACRPSDRDLRRAITGASRKRSTRFWRTAIILRMRLGIGRRTRLEGLQFWLALGGTAARLRVPQGAERKLEERSRTAPPHMSSPHLSNSSPSEGLRTGDRFFASEK
jgi:hypothetical protein